MLHCDLMDLGFHGNSFIWSNNQVNQLVQAHLYWGLVNHSQLDIFYTAQLHHLRFSTSDHCPILVKLAVDILDKAKPRCSVCRFEPTRFKSTNCLPQFLAAQHGFLEHQPQDISKRIQFTRDSLRAWSISTFGDLRKNIKIYHNELDVLLVASEVDGLVISQKRRELEMLLDMGESYWHQRS